MKGDSRSNHLFLKESGKYSIFTKLFAILWVTCMFGTVKQAFLFKCLYLCIYLYYLCIENYFIAIFHWSFIERHHYFSIEHDTVYKAVLTKSYSGSTLVMKDRLRCQKDVVLGHIIHSVYGTLTPL